MIEAKTTDWELFNVPLGKGTMEFPGDQQYPPFSVVYVCPACGQSWARIAIGSEKWHPRPRYCPDHGVGLLLPYGDLHLHKRVPSPVLRWEISRIAKMQHPERIIVAYMFGQE